MTDVCLTVPKNFTYDLAPGRIGLAARAAEGDLPGEPWSGQEWEFTTWGHRPDIAPGERVYVACQVKLRGYAPLVRLIHSPRQARNGGGRLTFIRGGGAVAVTVPQEIIGFRGWKYRWWRVEDEVPFPDWLADAETAAAPVEPCQSERHRRAGQTPRAMWCVTCPSPVDGSILAHLHLCTTHADVERRRPGHAAVVPVAQCPGRAAAEVG